MTRTQTKPLFAKSVRSEISTATQRRAFITASLSVQASNFAEALKPNDLQLDKIRLNELQRDISKLTNSNDSKLSFNPVALPWLKTKERPTSLPASCAGEPALRTFRHISVAKPLIKSCLHCEEWDALWGAKVSAQTRNHEISTLYSRTKWHPALECLGDHGISGWQI